LNWSFSAIAEEGAAEGAAEDAAEDAEESAVAAARGDRALGAP
jgi:hypothetical protein